MRVVAFDIETVPDLNGLNYRDYKYLRARGRRDRSEEEFEREVAFNPFTLFVVSFSATIMEEGTLKESVVFYISDLEEEPRDGELNYSESDSLRVRYLPLRAGFVEGKLYELEKELLTKVWEFIDKADRVVSFNGYGFDGYILKLRSMLHDLNVPSKFLRGRDFHIDLMHFLSNGEREKRYTLDFVCRKFGVYTPKDIIDGSKVAQEFYKGNYRTIALYNLKDSLSLAQLYLRLSKYLPPAKEEEPPTEKQLNTLMSILNSLLESDPDTLRKALETSLGKNSISELIELMLKLLKESRSINSRSS